MGRVRTEGEGEGKGKSEDEGDDESKAGVVMKVKACLIPPKHQVSHLLPNSVIPHPFFSLHLFCTHIHGPILKTSVTCSLQFPKPLFFSKG